MNVVLVAWSLGRVGSGAVGGAEQVLWNLERGLVHRGHRTTTIAGEGSDVAGELVALPVPEGTLDALAQAQQHERVRAALRRALARERIDLVHLHGVDFDHYLPPPGPPALVTLHLPAGWYAPSALAPARPRTFLHCVSASQRRGFPAGTRLLHDVANGVAVGAFRPARRKAGFALALGRVSPEKGFDAGLTAARRAGVSMILAGRVFPFPAHERHFRRHIAPLLDARRVFVGPVGLARKRRLLAGARCLVVPSAVPETSSIVAMEALASGTPVVAFRVGALPEVVEHGKTGFLVESIEEMADAIRDAGALSAEACRIAAEERFSADAMVESYLDLYEQVIAAEERAVPVPVAVAGAPGEGASERRRNIGGSLSVAEVHGLDALERLRPMWEELWQRDPRATAFQHPSWILTWCERFWTQPFALVARRGSEPVGLAVLHAHTWRGRRLVQLASGPLADVQDLLCDPEQAHEAAAAILERVAARTSQGETIELEDVPDGSPLLAIEAPRRARDAIEAIGSCPELALPSSVEALREVAPLWDGYRYERRRAARGGALAFEVATPGAFDALFDELVRLNRLRWSERGEGGAFVDPAVADFHRNAARRLLERGALRLRVVRYGGRAIAALYGWHERAHAAVYLTGFDPAAARLSPGKLLLGEAIEAAVREGARVYRFLRGRESYKYRWGALDRLQFRRRLGPLAAAHADEAAAKLQRN